MREVIDELLDDIKYVSLTERLLIIAVFLCFGAACFVSGFVTSKYY